VGDSADFGGSDAAGVVDVNSLAKNVRCVRVKMGLGLGNRRECSLSYPRYLDYQRELSQLWVTALEVFLTDAAS
jgi:hypothetical protein